MEGKGRGMWEVRLRRDLERVCSTGFWETKCGTKRKVREIERSVGGKGSTTVRESGMRDKQSNNGRRRNRKEQKLITDEGLLVIGGRR